MPPHGDVIPDARAIAVLRANGLGDFIVALPALEALRAAYPRAEIVLLGKEWLRGFLAGRPGPIDRVVVVPPYRGVSVDPDADEDHAALQRFFANMRRERFDLALQLHGGGRHSNPFTTRLGARVTAGLRDRDAPPLDRWVPYIYFQHEILRYLEVASLVGATPVTLQPRLPVTKADVAESHALTLDADTPLVALHPGASDPSRRWPAAKFAAVGDAMADAGARVALTGIEDERDVVNAVIASMRHTAIDACGRLSLGGLAGLFARCRVVVANDTGPRHLAEAVGAATVGVFWCFNLVNFGPITRTRHRPFVSWQFICPMCGADRSHFTCPHQPSFVADVPVHDVIAAALELLRAGE